MELFEKVDSVAHYNYQDSNGGPLNFVKHLGGVVGAQQSVSTFLGWIKDMIDKLGDIGEKVSNTDLVIISLNGMLEDYQMFITGLAAREKAPNFEELIGILLQE